MHASDPTDPSTTDAQQALREEIKDLIVTTLRLENVDPRDIGDTELLFSPDARLGLDSLAALELLAAIEFTKSLPRPGQLKTVSTTTLPPTEAPNPRANAVTTGRRALRAPCRMMIDQLESPFMRAIVIKSSPMTSSMLERISSNGKPCR